MLVFFLIICDMLAMLLMPAWIGAQEGAAFQHGSFLWKGFDYQWVEDGHRIGNYASFVGDQAITDTDGKVQAQGQAVMRLSVGADGDYARPQVFYNFVYARTIGVLRGEVVFTLRSDTVPELSPAQSPPHALTMRWTHSLLTAAMRYGTFDQYTAVLQGFEMAVRCPEGDDGCHTASWLRDFGVTLDHCAASHGEYSCDTHLYLQRYHAPDALRGLPPSVEYQVRVFYAIFGGSLTDFTFTSAESVVATTHLKGAPPGTQKRRIQGACSAQDDGCLAGGMQHYAVGTMGMLGLRYQLQRLPDGSPALGRYVKRLIFQLRDGVYDPHTGTMDYQVEYALDPARHFAHDSQIHYQLSAQLLQFREAAVLGDSRASGVVCQYTSLTMGLRRCKGLFGHTYTYPKLRDVIAITN